MDIQLLTYRGEVEERKEGERGVTETTEGVEGPRKAETPQSHTEEAVAEEKPRTESSQSEILTQRVEEKTAKHLLSANPGIIKGM